MDRMRKSRKVEITPDGEYKTEEPQATDKLLQDFSSYTTVHGLHFLFDSHSKIRRLIWIALLIVSTAILVVQFIESWEKFASNYSVIGRRIEKSDSLVFPAVSICNQNMMKKSKIEGKDAQAYLDRIDPLKARVARNISSAFDVEKAVLESGHNAFDMILQCTWKGRECGPQNFTRFFSFLRGMCYTFNSGKEGHPLLSVTTSGKTHGLSLYLDAEPEEYYGPFSYDATGFKVLVHDQKEDFPNMEDEAQDVSPGFNTVMRIKRIKIISLKHPFSSECDEKKLANFQTYSQYACLYECYTNMTISSCGCRIFSMPGEFNQSRYCNTTKIVNCVSSAFDKFNPSQCDCPEPCEQVKYSAELSQAYFPSNSFLNAIRQVYKNDSEELNLTLEETRKRIAHVTVFYKTTVSDVIRERPAYDLNDLGSDVGGNMGLFLGCSVLTLCEFIDLVFVGILTRWRRARTNRPA